jgi:hypothetical protein
MFTFSWLLPEYYAASVFFLLRFSFHLTNKAKLSIQPMQAANILSCRDRESWRDWKGNLVTQGRKKQKQNRLSRPLHFKSEYKLVMKNSIKQ